VLLAAKKRAFGGKGLRFDEAFDFHCYDLDICRQAEAAGLTMGTIPLGIMHEGTGRCGTPAWQANYERYIKKWRN
jgi:hypothetical protein